MPFSRVLLGLNITGIGWVLAQNLARHFGDVDRLMAATQEEVEAVEGYGPDRAEIVVEWFADDQNRALVQELRGLGLRFETGEEERPAEGPLTGSTYVITGTLEGFSRDEAAAALEAQGAKVTNSVSKKTTGLVVGEEPGRVEADQGAARRRAAADGGRPAEATGRLAPRRTGPAPRAPSRGASRSGGSRTRSGLGRFRRRSSPPAHQKRRPHCEER